MLEDRPKIALLCMSAAIHKVKNNSGWEFIEVLSHFFHFLFYKNKFWTMMLLTLDAGYVDHMGEK